MKKLATVLIVLGLMLPSFGQAQGTSKLKGDTAIVDIAKGISRVLSNSNNSVNGFIVNSN